MTFAKLASIKHYIDLTIQLSQSSHTEVPNSSTQMAALALKFCLLGLSAFHVVLFDATSGDTEQVSGSSSFSATLPLA